MNDLQTLLQITEGTNDPIRQKIAGTLATNGCVLSDIPMLATKPVPCLDEQYEARNLFTIPREMLEGRNHIIHPVDAMYSAYLKALSMDVNTKFFGADDRYGPCPGGIRKHLCAENSVRVDNLGAAISDGILSRAFAQLDRPDGSGVVCYAPDRIGGERTGTSSYFAGHLRESSAGWPGRKADQATPILDREVFAVRYGASGVNGWTDGLPTVRVIGYEDHHPDTHHSVFEWRFYYSVRPEDFVRIYEA